MNIDTELKQSKAKLERLRGERQQGLANWKTRIADAKQRGVRGDAWVDLQAQFRKWDEMNWQTISNTGDKIKELTAALESETAQKQTAARAELGTLKEMHCNAWLENGGTQAGFDSAWPEMEKQILIERTTSQLETKTASVKKDYSSIF